MKIIRVETLQAVGPIATSDEWQRIRSELHNAIRSIVWPPGSDRFTIHPQSGKKRGEGNGVVPIKQAMLNALIREVREDGWKAEQALDIATVTKPGKLDAVIKTRFGPVAMEWETGNISSSHRALNKMCLGLMNGILAAGTLIVPSRNLYQYLTDRVGNFAELEPYLDLWRSIPIGAGVLEIVVIEHDAESTDVPRIPKGTSGRALG